MSGLSQKPFKAVIPKKAVPVRPLALKLQRQREDRWESPDTVYALNRGIPDQTNLQQAGQESRNVLSRQPR